MVLGRFRLFWLVYVMFMLEFLKFVFGLKVNSIFWFLVVLLCR